MRDPTGCGDAYRAGLILGLLPDLDWETTGRVAGALKIEHHGTQNRRFAHSELAARYEEGFGASPRRYALGTARVSRGKGDSRTPARSVAVQSQARNVCDVPGEYRRYL